jgi:CRISPR-associated endoribonuclease Cas6
MLISILLQLTTEHPASLPAHLGRANHAATLRRIAAIDPALAEQIHAGDGPKPITCSGLWGGRRNGEAVTVQPGERCAVRISGLAAPVSRALEQALLAGPPATWTLDDHPFVVTGAVCDAGQEPWSGRTTYEELAAAQLLQAGRLPRQATLEFASPTAFKSAGMTVPVPLPGLVFGSLVERWNAFSPVTLSPEARRFGEEMVAISRYRLESLAVGQKNSGLRIGGVGRATYTALGGDRYWLGVMQMLADFALYSGVGVMTTTGMGQCRRG